ncbi:MAG TPA: GHKL domain-containing protein, partial [Nitrospirae bacterium]|nr:GHKL domain-containing protein [Nitrospirota bacterium]
SYQVEAKGVDIARKYSSSVPEVMLDREKMRQVFMNIIVNAIQAVSPGGEIMIESNCNKSQSRIFISVRDNGVGIPEEIRGRIFEPFFTTKEPGEGTGLGLSVSYGIVKEHHGDIIVESEVGRGSTFTVSLPMERGVRSGHV